MMHFSVSTKKMIASYLLSKGNVLLQGSGRRKQPKHFNFRLKRMSQSPFGKAFNNVCVCPLPSPLTGTICFWQTAWSSPAVFGYSSLLATTLGVGKGEAEQHLKKHHNFQAL